jgi:hypothetical protein
LAIIAASLPFNVAVADALPDHDNGPLTGLFGFPDSTEAGRTLSRRATGFALSASTASHNIDEMRGTESLRFDGETSRMAFSYRYGVTERLELGIEIPYLWHQSGSLDAFIDGWHDFFGLPEGPRALRDRDRLELYYSDPQSSAVSVTRNTNGPGDVRLQAGWQLSAGERSATALRFSVKLPTGDSDMLHGSGGTDISVGIVGDASGIRGMEKVSGFYRADVIYLGAPDVLSARANDVVGQIAAGIGFLAHRNVDLRLQARIRSAVYESDIENLGGVSAMLTAGVDFRLSDRYRFTLAIGEDINPDSAPDISLLMAFRYLGPVNPYFTRPVESDNALIEARGAQFGDSTQRRVTEE